MSSRADRIQGRILALDVGKKRIGLAISDALHITAQPLPTLHRLRIRDDLAELKRVIAEREVELLVVGRPLHLSGDESRQSAYTAEFAQRLGTEARVPVKFWDERLTSVEAERILRAGGANLNERKRAVDQLSAVLILQSFMEHEQMAQLQDNEAERAGE